MYSAAACVKIFQLLLGEVNECNDWRVSNYHLDDFLRLIYIPFFLLLRIACSLVVYTSACVCIYIAVKISPTALSRKGIQFSFLPTLKPFNSTIMQAYWKCITKLVS